MLFHNQFLDFRDALEWSWGRSTSLNGVWDARNPARGQCYPSSILAARMIDGLGIFKGSVLNGDTQDVEKHYWNFVRTDRVLFHVDFTWQQFPPLSRVIYHKVVDLAEVEPRTKDEIARVNGLTERVQDYMRQHHVDRW